MLGGIRYGNNKDCKKIDAVSHDQDEIYYK